jgi:hypothetical protein
MSFLPTFPADCAALEQTVRKFNARMVVIDPIDAALNPKIDGNKNTDVRQVLSQLRGVAEETGCTILLVRHLSKDTKVTSPIYRGLGSIGMTAAARATFLVGRLPDDPSVRVLTGIKCNHSALPPSLGFKVCETTVENPDKDGEPIRTLRIEWIGKVEVNSRDMLTEPEPARHGPKPTRREAAVALIKEFLADGLEHSANELDAKAATAKISTATLWRARKDLGVRSRKKGYGDDWLISLSNLEDESKGEVE